VCILPNFIVVDSFCGEAVLRGSNIFVPGVLASNNKCKPYLVKRGDFLSIYVTDHPPLKGSILTLEQLTNPVFVGNGTA
jgi:predicted ribosome-associated RNA-binding protein Tma20